MDREQTAAMFRRMADLFQWFAANEWDSDALEGLKMYSGALAPLCRFLRGPKGIVPKCSMFGGGPNGRHLIVAMEPLVLLRLLFETASKDGYRDAEWDEIVRNGVVVQDPSLSGASLLRSLVRLGFSYSGSMDIIDITGSSWGRLSTVPKLVRGEYPTHGSLWDEDRRSRQSGFAPAHISLAVSIAFMDPLFFKPQNVYVFSGTTVSLRDSGGKVFYPTVARDQETKALTFALVATSFEPRQQDNYVDVCIQKQRTE